jgi:hypothetical protein
LNVGFEVLEVTGLGAFQFWYFEEVDAEVEEAAFFVSVLDDF